MVARGSGGRPPTRVGRCRTRRPAAAPRPRAVPVRSPRGRRSRRAAPALRRRPGRRARPGERVEVVLDLGPVRLDVPGQQHQEVPQRVPVHEVDARQVLAAPVPLHADQERGQQLALEVLVGLVGLGVLGDPVGGAGHRRGHPVGDVGPVDQDPGPVESRPADLVGREHGELHEVAVVVHRLHAVCGLPEVQHEPRVVGQPGGVGAERLGPSTSGRLPRAPTSSAVNASYADFSTTPPIPLADRVRH